LVGIAIGAYPFALQAMNERQLSSESTGIEKTVSGWPAAERADALAAARAYNTKLAASGQPVLGEAVDPFSTQSGQSTTSDDDDSESAKDTTYQSLLDISGDGVMGSIVIPKISVNLPIYHGSSDEVLARGVGHLYGTSLPVGGASTHSVLTGHRGLVSALMFTRLDEMKIGDYFYIKVLGKTLGYKVDRISVILPNDTSKLRVTKGEDRVTLMTCTPYGVNTHRLLVSGVRAKIPQQIPAIEEAPLDTKQLLEYMAVIAIPATLLAFLVAGRRGRVRRRRHFSGTRIGARDDPALRGRGRNGHLRHLARRRSYHAALT
uniref:class C sortase n=1 Tax=uncultured Bifidobacterium sp. TaxID=165187 RepID=UPI0028DCEF7C